MKKKTILILALFALFALTACGKAAPAPAAAPTPVAAETPSPTPEPTAAPTPAPTPEPLPLIPDLPEVHDEALEQIFEAVLSVYPGTAGTSLRAARCAAWLLDWGAVTTLTDDEIYSAVGCFLDELSDEDLLTFFESFYSVYDAAYDLKGESAKDLLDSAGASDCRWPWNEHAFHALEMVSYGLGPR